MKTLSLLGIVTSLLLAGAVVAPAAEAVKLDADVQDAIQLFQKTDPKMQPLFQSAYGYVVFPSVGKGAAGIGAAGGQGQVFEKGALIGEAKMNQVTVGAQLGGQSYAEVIFFETPKALNEFKDGKTAMAAGVSAVVAADGVSADAKYQHGVLVYTMAKNGLMFEASVGGQRFKFTPLSTTAAPATTSTQTAPLATKPAQQPETMPAP